MSIQAAARCSLASAQWQVNQSPPCSAHQPPVDCSLGCWASARGSWGVKGSALMYKGVDKNAACTAVLLTRYARSTASLWLRARSPATATSGGRQEADNTREREPGGWVQRPTTRTRHRPPEDRTRRRRWRTRALTTLPGHRLVVCCGVNITERGATRGFFCEARAGWLGVTSNHSDKASAPRGPHKEAALAD